MLVWILLIACAVLVYRYADMEGMSGIFWAGMSILLFLLGSMVGLVIPFGGLLVPIGLQFGLMVLMRVLAIRRQGHY